MRCFLLLLVLFFPLGWAADEVVSPRTRVLYTDPALADYAQRVATSAEAALDILVPVFGAPGRPITINLRDDTDVFNAYATPLPRPNTAVWSLFPNSGVVGLRAANPLFLVVLHELTHVSQLTYTDRPEEGTPFRLGLVGEGTAKVPPAWFVEGLATWFESEHTQGGRRDAALSKGVLETLVLGEDWPSLTEAGLAGYDAWPGGNVRYLLGVSFTEHLISTYGLDKILELLKTYNAGGFLGTFSGAWAKALGTNLEDEWESWRQNVLARAEARADTLDEPDTLTESGWLTGSAALSPDGKQLAYLLWPYTINVATLGEDGLQDERTLIEDRLPETLAWLDDDTLLYNRIVRRPGSQFLELFSLDVVTGEETQLTSGARAQFPAPLPNGCILYVRDVVTEGSSLRQWCDGDTTERWRAPNDTHLTGLTVSPEGRIVVGLWRAGQVDLALLEGENLTFLTQDLAVDTEPAWLGETALLFSSDRSDAGVFEVYRLELATGQLTQLTQTLGGAFEPVASRDSLVFTSLGEKGYDLARAGLPGFPALDEAEQLELQAESGQVYEPDEELEARFEVRRYSPLPSLVPYGWLPLGLSATLSPITVSAAATVLGQDDSGVHSYALTLGYGGTLSGPLAGFHSDIQYAYREPNLLSSLLQPQPLGFSVRFGLWPHTPHLLPTTETAFGARVGVSSSLPLDTWIARGRLTAGLLYLSSADAWQPDLSATASLSRQRADSWDYRTQGPRFSVTGVLSATPDTPSVGTWANATYYASLPVLGLSGTGELGLRAGYRQAPPLPLVLEDYAAVATAGYRSSFSTELRYGDGLYALERLSVELRGRTWFDGGFGLGADLSLSADTLLNYQAPVSFGVTLGYAQGFWSRVGVRLPL